MRIAYLLTQDRGGPVDVTINLAEYLAGCGHEVKVFGPRPARCSVALLSLLEEVSVRSKFDVDGLRSMVAKVREWGPDIVHAQDRRAGMVASAARLLGRLNAPVVGTYHGVPEDVSSAWFNLDSRAAGPSFYSRLVLAGDGLVARILSRTIMPSVTMRSFASRRFRLPEHSFDVVPNGVPTAVGSSRLSGSVRELLYVGMLIDRKGLSEFLDALSIVSRGGLQVRLTIAGDGPLRQTLEEKANFLGLGDAVAFLGFRSDVTELMHRFDAVILPSWMEQQPIAIIEAMLAGKPVLSTRVGGVEDMLGRVSPAELFVRPGDVEDIARGLRFLCTMQHPETLGERLASEARVRFSVAESARQHLVLYGDLVSQ